MTGPTQSKKQEIENNQSRRAVAGGQGENATLRPSPVPASEETEGATGALDVPATPPEMTRDGKVDSNKR